MSSGPQRATTGEYCRVYWGTHGCCHERGHDGPHECEDHAANHHHNDEDGEWVCVAKPPYYGPETSFYGEDAPSPTSSEEQDG